MTPERLCPSCRAAPSHPEEHCGGVTSTQRDSVSAGRMLLKCRASSLVHKNVKISDCSGLGERPEFNNIDLAAGSGITVRLLFLFYSFLYDSEFLNLRAKALLNVE